MKTTLSLLLLLWSFVTLSSAKVIEFKVGTIYKAGQDKEGVIWLDANRPGSLIRYSGEIHETLALPELGSKAKIVTFKNLPDGTLLCFWETASDEYTLTSHQGKVSKILAKGKGRLTEFPRTLSFATDKEGRLWFAGRDNTIRYFDPSINQLRDVYTVTGGIQFYEGNPKFDILNKIQLVADSSGKIWAYTAGYTNHKYITSLIFLGNPDLPRLVSLSELKDPKFKSVVPFQGKLLITLSGEDRFYLFDPQSETVEAIAPPEEGLFKTSGPLQFFNGEIYFTQWVRLKPTPLWHFSQSRKATKLSSSVGDRDLTFIQSHTDPKSFFLIGQRFQYLSPSKKSDLTLDWSTDFPFYTPTHLFPLKKQGEYFALCNIQAYEGPLPPPAAKKTSPSRIIKLPPYPQWSEGKEGEIWAIDNTDENAPLLEHWDGEKWNHHPLKDYIPSGGHQYEITPDTHGRIWLRQRSSKEARTVLFYPSEKRWETFPTFRDALQSTRTIPFEALYPKEEFDERPAYSSKGEIAYYSRYREIHYFDGTEWKSWPAGKIGRHSISYRPFFDDNGNLGFALGKEGYKLTGEGKWEPSPFPIPPPPNQNTPFPEGILDSRPNQHLTDKQGKLWFIKDLNLYRTKGSRYAPVFRKGEPSPLIAPSHISSLTEDRNGNLFLELHNDRFFVPTTSPPPKTTLKRKPTKYEDRVEITLNVSSKANCTVRWKLNNGAWKLAKPGETVALGPLTTGKYEFIAQAEDEFLMEEAEPARLEFEIKIDPQKQLAQLLKSLDGTSENERIGAVEALATMPERALPALEGKLADASSNTRWWINLAIQKCEEAKRRRAAP